MKIEQLQQRIRLGEDSTLELKQLLLRDDGKTIEPHPDGLSDELAALANAKGGVLILGVDDKSREISGIATAQLDRVEAWLTAICNDRIKPPLDVVTHHVELPDTQGVLRAVIVVEVPQSLWVHQSAHGYFRRVGHAKRELPPDALARLFQQRSQARIIRFEEQEVPDCHFDDLDALLLRRFIKADQGDAVTQLGRLHLLSLRDGEPLPTVAGVLLCTLNPARWLRNTEIIAVAHAGVRHDPNDQIDALEIQGPLDRQIFDAFHFVRRNMQTAARKHFGRVDYPQYHLDAVFEAIVNAVAHRDYSLYSQRIRLFMFADRLEIHSPGALPNTLSLESMRQLSVSRNDILASLFSRYYPVNDPALGKSYLMDRRGFGVEMILRESEKLSGKRPLYEAFGDLELCLTLYAQELPAEGESMNTRALNHVMGRLSLRPPQAESLLRLVRALEAAPELLGHERVVSAILSTLKAEFPTLGDFEREFPSLCFALATGVGKTRLMGAFVAYLHLAHGINNFFVLAPNLTIYNKLIADFTRNTPKYVFKGIAEFAQQPPLIITGDNYDQTGAVVRDQTLGGAHDVRINIFNISKINSEVRGGREPRIKRMKEVLGDSYFNHLANLSDLVLLMDESHRYRASAGVRSINELKPLFGLEVTATPFVESTRGPVPFKNVVMDYPLG